MMDLDRVHQILRQTPPPGVSAAYVDGFFARNHAGLQRIVDGIRPEGILVDGGVLDAAIRAVLRAAADPPSTWKAPSGMAMGLGIRLADGHTEVAASNGEVAARVRIVVKGDLAESGLPSVGFHRDQAERLLGLTGPVRLRVQGRALRIGGAPPGQIPELQDPLPGFEYMWPLFHQTGWTLGMSRAQLLNALESILAELPAEEAVFHRYAVVLDWTAGGPRLAPVESTWATPLRGAQFNAVKKSGMVGINGLYLRSALESLSGPTVRLRQPGGRTSLSRLSPIEITENTDDPTRPAWLVAPVRLE